MLCLLLIAETIAEKSQQHELHKDGTNAHAKLDGGKAKETATLH